MMGRHHARILQAVLASAARGETERLADTGAAAGGPADGAP